MTFQTFTETTAGRWCFTAVALFIPFSPPFVILAYKYRKGTPLESWGLWFAFDLVLLFMAFGSLSQIWSRLQGLSMQSIGLQIGLPTSIMYIFCIALALFIIWEYKIRNTSKGGGGGGGGGQQPYNDKDGGFSLNKSSRRRAVVDNGSSGDEEEGRYGNPHLESVVDARAKAARATREQALRDY
ncbi:hypothetical protein JCM5353_002709 [Sporobolomyces roseus]